MSKKIGVTILLLGILVVIAGGAYLYFNKSKDPESRKNETNNKNESNNVDSIDSCSGCKFLYMPNTAIWVSWNTDGNTPTKITSTLKDSYLEITKSSVNRYFLGVKLNNENEIMNIYACGVQNNVPFCVEAASDGSKYENNKTILKNKVWNDSYIIDKNTENNEEYEVTYCRPTEEYVGVQIFSEGTVKIGDNDNSLCIIKSNGYAYCKDLEAENSN